MTPPSPLPYNTTIQSYHTTQYHNTELLLYALQSYYSTHYRAITLPTQFYNKELLLYTILQYRAITLHNTTIQSYMYYTTQYHKYRAIILYRVTQYRAITIDIECEIFRIW